MNRLTSLTIQGYRPFRDFTAPLGELEVLVGANGSGKSALFEFLRFLRDAMRYEIPPEIVPGTSGQQIFHQGPARIAWGITVSSESFGPYCYEGEVRGPLGQTQVSMERVTAVGQDKRVMGVSAQHGTIRTHPDSEDHEEIHLRRPNQLALGTIKNPRFAVLYDLREFIADWHFYSSFNISSDKLRQAVPVEQDPILAEDAGNLSAVLFNLMTEHRQAFDDLQHLWRSLIPGFRGLHVKARGAPGQVIAFWVEDGIYSELTLADLSDGILRLLCWTVLAVHPKPPTLICIDEPDQGVHPRTLPVLAGLFEKASQRTQILLATHASYFLTLFDFSRIAVMRKQNGQAWFLKPRDSAVLREMLADFGPMELEHLHRSDELEYLP